MLEKHSWLLILHLNLKFGRLRKLFIRQVTSLKTIPIRYFFLIKCSDNLQSPGTVVPISFKPNPNIESHRCIQQVHPIRVQIRILNLPHLVKNEIKVFPQRNVRLTLFTLRRLKSRLRPQVNSVQWEWVRIEVFGFWLCENEFLLRIHHCVDREVINVVEGATEVLSGLAGPIFILNWVALDWFTYWEGGFSPLHAFGLACNW